jgi:hypothetical protein
MKAKSFQSNLVSMKRQPKRGRPGGSLEIESKPLRSQIESRCFKLKAESLRIDFGKKESRKEERGSLDIES